MSKLPYVLGGAVLLGAGYLLYKKTRKAEAPAAQNNAADDGVHHATGLVWTKDEDYAKIPSAEQYVYDDVYLKTMAALHDYVAGESGQDDARKLNTLLLARAGSPLTGARLGAQTGDDAIHQLEGMGFVVLVPTALSLGGASASFKPMPALPDTITVYYGSKDAVGQTYLGLHHDLAVLSPPQQTVHASP